MINLIKGYRPSTPFLVIVAVALMVFISWEAVYSGSSPTYQYMPVDRLRIAEFTFHSSVTANGDSTAYNVGSFGSHTFYVNLASGTATITPKFSPDGTNWVSGNAETASGIYAYPLCDAKEVKVTISSCSSCNVSVWGISRNK